jgi:hypothetical protein
MGLSGVHIVGNSMGGATAIGVAIDRAELFDRIVLMGSAGFASAQPAAGAEPDAASPPVHGLRLSLSRLEATSTRFAGGGECACRVSRRLELLLSAMLLADLTPSARWPIVLESSVDNTSAARRCSDALRVLLLTVDGDSRSALRLYAASGPLRLRLDENVLLFATAFLLPAGAAPSPSTEVVVGRFTLDDDPLAALAEADNAVDSIESDAPLFASVSLSPLLLIVDYRHRSQALPALLPVAGLRLRLPPVRLARLEGGWTALGAEVAEQWASEVRARQAHRLLKGLLRGITVRLVKGGRARIASWWR